MEQYRAPRWLIGGNVQTIWPALFGKRFEGLAPRYRRERWDTPDGDFIDVDWQEEGQDGPHHGALAARSAVMGRAATAGDTPVAHAAARVDTAVAQAATAATAITAVTAPPPLLVLFHGLEGSSASHYALAFADWARSHGWRYAVPHFRGCSGEMNRAPRAYHSGDFEEIAWVLAQMRRRHAGRIVAVGISLGGNALLRWAGEAGTTAADWVSAVAAVSAPVDLAAGGRAIDRGFNRQVYARMFLRSMKPKALRLLAMHPGLFDRDRLLAARDLHAFDDVFTAPLHGFEDADDYWRRGSAKPHLTRVRLPALVLNARNDPFIPASSLPRPNEVSASVTLWQPAQGGHVGFATGSWPGHVLTLPDEVMAWVAAQT